MDSDDIKLQPLVLNNLGISIPFTYTNSKSYSFEIRLDKEYPFNRPQIHSLDHINYYG
jgi:ubiquitin-protein ligase